jgi:hypothetical protein
MLWLTFGCLPTFMLAAFRACLSGVLFAQIVCTAYPLARAPGDAPAVLGCPNQPVESLLMRTLLSFRMTTVGS